jgi:hypothetical protein
MPTRLTQGEGGRGTGEGGIKVWELHTLIVYLYKSAFILSHLLSLLSVCSSRKPPGSGAS